MRMVSILRLAFLLAVMALISACQASLTSTPAPAATQTPPAAATRKAKPTQPPAHPPTFTPIPSYTPIPASEYPPTPDPTREAIVQELLDSVDAKIIPLSVSPDHQWSAQLLKRPCTGVPSGAPETYAYEVLQIARLPDGPPVEVDHQLQVCGGVGAFGLGEIAWSQDSRYYYYTDAREGSPDGGNLGWLRSIYRYDPLNQAGETLGRSAFSPDGTLIASSETYALGQRWAAPRALVVRSITGETLARLESSYPPNSWGYQRIAWSADGARLAYSETACPAGKKCSSSLFVVNGENWERQTVLASWAAEIQDITWDGPDRITLVDESFQKWIVDLATGAVNQQPQ